MNFKKLYLVPTLALAVTMLILQGCDDDEKDEPTPVPPAENLNPGPCDDNISLTESQAINVAKAFEVCKASTGTDDWGLVTARFIRADDTEIVVNNQFGVMPAFGANNSARRGTNMVLMSTGGARTPAQPGSCGSSGCTGTGVGQPPAGIPVDITGCPPSMNIYDDVGIKLTLRVPSSATGFSIDHNFFTFDYPEFVCNGFNDQFVILVDPSPSGALNGHVAIDSLGKPIGVNSALLAPSNTSLLNGTGFDTWGDAAATGWVRTTVPVVGGTTITVRLLIYDLGDQVSDSSVLLDNFTWLTGNVSLKTSRL